jgi:AcrR family transcriptional regulator
MSTNSLNKSDQRRDRILSVAKTLFFEVGYANATMNEIAARVGGSKATLYAYFKSKEDLFAAIITGHCEKMHDILRPHIGTKDIANSLKLLSREILTTILSDANVRTIQLMVEEAQRNPQLAQMFQQKIDENGRKAFNALLREAHVSGQIDVPDTEEAAVLFKSLLMGDLAFKRILSVIPEPDEATLNARIERAVSVFMAYYGAKGA